jgi:hypothetical protein
MEYMIGKRQFLAGLGVMATSTALAQIHTPVTPPKKQIPQRRAKTVKLFKAPEFYPNCLAIPERSDAGLWIGQQKLKGIQASGSGVPEQPGPDLVWLMDWNGKVLKTYESASQVTSGLAVSKTRSMSSPTTRPIIRRLTPACTIWTSRPARRAG